MAEEMTATDQAHVNNIAGAAANAMAANYNNNTGHFKAMDQLREGFMGSALERFSTLDTQQMVGTAGVIKQQADSGIASLGTQVALAGINAKQMQSVPGDVSIELGKIGGILTGLQAQINSMNASK